MRSIPPNVCTPALGVARFTVPLALPSPDHLHVHVLETPDGPLLVDCGARGSELALAAALQATGATDARVLITHAHVDHWGLASSLTDRVLAHPGVLSSLRFAIDGPPVDDSTANGWPDRAELERAFAGFSELISGVPEIEAIGDGDRLGDWEVLWTPGHDPGHVCLFRDSDGVLLCGDLLLPGFTPNIQPDPSGRDALGDFLASLRRVAALPVRLVLPAHGERYEDAARRAQELERHHEARLDVLRGALRGGPRHLDELCATAFGAAHDVPADRMLAAMETYAHLDHLHRLGEATVDNEGRWLALP